MLLREARPADARAMEQVRVDGWQAAYAGLLPERFLAGLGIDEERVAWREAALAAPPPGHVTLVAEEGGEVLGATFLLPSRDEDLSDAAELATLYVRPAAWSRGIGSRLLTETFTRSTAALQVLWTLEANAGARRFYERHGFVADGARRLLDLGGPVPEVRYRRARPT